MTATPAAVCPPAIATPTAAPLAVALPDILAARDRLRGQIANTPFLESRTLGAMAGCRLQLKFENHQFTASFKERGAANRLALLDETGRRAGVIAVSAGNHAQGVAHHAQRLGVRAVIVMPGMTPAVKVENTRRLGAEVILCGDTFEQARTAMLEIADREGLVIIHPYDDPAVIAGQGTLGLEMLEASADLDTLVVPIGGGGLIGGIAVAARALRPDLRIIGVQTSLFPAAWHRFQSDHGHRVSDPADLGGPTLAEGIAVEHPGGLTMPLIDALVDDVMLVNEAAIERALVMLLEIEKTVVEGAGAAGLAAVLSDPARFAGRHVGLVLTGGNIDPLTLSDVVCRSLARSQRLARLAISARDIPGSLARIATILGAQGANIEEVTHQRVFADLPVRHTRIEVVISARGPAHIESIQAALAEAGFSSRLIPP